MPMSEHDLDFASAVQVSDEDLARLLTAEIDFGLQGDGLDELFDSDEVAAVTALASSGANDMMQGAIAESPALPEVAPEVGESVNEVGKVSSAQAGTGQADHIPGEIMAQISSLEEDNAMPGLTNVRKSAPAHAQTANARTVQTHGAEELRNAPQIEVRQYQQSQSYREPRTDVQSQQRGGPPRRPGAPGNFDGRQSSNATARRPAPPGSANVFTATVPQLAPRTALLVQQPNRNQPGRTPFADVGEARAWFLNHSQAVFRIAVINDRTIPHGLTEKQQKRAAATKLRVAFQSAQPVKSDEEFHIVDELMLELTQLVTFSHLSSKPLVAQYISGKSKTESALSDTFDAHIDTLVKVLGTQNAKGKAIRKHLTDAPYIKRLIDNPLGELDVVKKNIDNNAKRKLKADETKAQAANSAAVQEENERLKALLSARSTVGSGAAINDRIFATPVRPSSRIPGPRKSAMARQHRPEIPATPSSAGESWPQTSDVGSSPSAIDSADNTHQSTLTDTQGPSAPKRAKHGDFNTITAQSTPAQKPAVIARPQRNNTIIGIQRNQQAVSSPFRKYPFDQQGNPAPAQQNSFVQQSPGFGSMGFSPNHSFAQSAHPMAPPSILNAAHQVQDMNFAPINVDSSFSYEAPAFSGPNDRYDFILANLTVGQLEDAAQQGLDIYANAFQLASDFDGIPGDRNNAL
jgi:hypothetical protein